MIQITDKPIDVQAVLQRVRSPAAGAVVLFLGTARERTGTRRTAWLDYECYPQMAEAKLTELREEACQQWSLAGCAIVHRVGRLEIGEVSVAIATSAAHRHEAFQAAQWLIDRIKQIVPIWKQEHWADGTSQWVHPGLDVPGASRRGDR
ncbi:MAG TPA: molybdenum cofactor biosynthesis protein MoaE [Planctomycetaceae bacterium]|nr:molybdenum cofactor biosynthesis protein MoaE [Planctomycetaceae bacterium]